MGRAQGEGGSLRWSGHTAPRCRRSEASGSGTLGRNCQDPSKQKEAELGEQLELARVHVPGDDSVALLG